MTGVSFVWGFLLISCGMAQGLGWTDNPLAM